MTQLARDVLCLGAGVWLAVAGSSAMSRVVGLAFVVFWTVDLIRLAARGRHRHA